MHVSNSNGDFRTLSSLSKSRSPLLRRLEALSQFRQEDVYRGLGLLISLAVGYLAYLSTWEDAVLDWQVRNQPTEKIWEISLRGLGYRKVTSPSLMDRALRKLPMVTDPQGRVWISEERGWIVVFRNEKSDRIPLVFTRLEIEEKLGALLSQPEIKRLPRGAGALISRSWKPLDFGWKGFEKLINELADHPIARERSTPPQRRYMGDSREIRY